MKVELDKYEIGVIINALHEFRNAKIKEDTNTDAIDDLYLKFAKVYEKYCTTKEVNARQ